ncbi:Probable L-type lectin-domain containing receptor kinase S.5 [Linum grandiflorum]
MMQETNPPLKLAAIIIFFFFITASSPVSCLYFNYTNFPDNSTSDFIRTNSYITANTIQITPDFLTNQSGRIFHHNRFRLYKPGDKPGGGRTASFDTRFTLQINPKTRPSGEGLAFILTENTILPGNSSGQWLGIANSVPNAFSSRIVAVEFDTRKSYPVDLDDNHVGLDINDVYSIRQESLSGFGINLSSSDVITARIRYNGYTLSVLVGKRLVLSHRIDLSEHLPEVVHVGFSGSTSRFVQQNCILSWEFSGSDISSSERGWWVWVVISVSAMGLIVGGFGFIYRRRKLARQKHRVEDGDEDGYEDVHPSIEEAIRGSSTAPKKFKLDELSDATGNFDSKNVLGKGGFGTVYKGILGNREVVAVKKVSEVTSQGKQEFVAEVTTIGNLRHKNLVKLIGWARERCEYLLVYEYMPNGSLDKFIFAPGSSSSMLTWGTRLKIITGVALALEYLHNGCERKVLHRDIKASNVMLDSKFDARLGDFGLARTIAQADQTHHSTKALAGTPGYMAPELFLTGRSTPETDVYGFGVLILEVVCGKRPVGGGQLDRDDYASNIVKWVWELYGTWRLIDAADRRMKTDYEDEKLCNIVLTLGLGCCHPDPYGRPSMKTVLQVLTGELAAVPEVPLERPPFTWPPVAPCFEDRRNLTSSQLFTEIIGR